MHKLLIYLGKLHFIPPIMVSLALAPYNIFFSSLASCLLIFF